MTNIQINESDAKTIELMDRATLLRRRRHLLRRMFRHIGGAWWGFWEGAASGALTGTNVSGAGGFFFGTLCQIGGALSGFLGGGISGLCIGLITDRDEMKEVMANYREHFGTKTRVVKYGLVS